VGHALTSRQYTEEENGRFIMFITATMLTALTAILLGYTKTWW
jgi:hypothetical protein